MISLILNRDQRFTVHQKYHPYGEEQAREFGDLSHILSFLVNKFIQVEKEIENIIFCFRVFPLNTHRNCSTAHQTLIFSQSIPQSSFLELLHNIHSRDKTNTKSSQSNRHRRNTSNQQTLQRKKKPNLKTTNDEIIHCNNPCSIHLGCSICRNKLLTRKYRQQRFGCWSKWQD